MAFRVERSEAASADLELIFDFLITAELDFGEDTETAFEHASSRIAEIERVLERIADAPFQGTLRPELGEKTCDNRPGGYADIRHRPGKPL